MSRGHIKILPFIERICQACQRISQVKIHQARLALDLIDRLDIVNGSARATQDPSPVDHVGRSIVSELISRFQRWSFDVPRSRTRGTTSCRSPRAGRHRDHGRSTRPRSAPSVYASAFSNSQDRDHVGEGHATISHERMSLSSVECPDDLPTLRHSRPAGKHPLGTRTDRIDRAVNLINRSDIVHGSSGTPRDPSPIAQGSHRPAYWPGCLDTVARLARRRSRPSGFHSSG